MTSHSEKFRMLYLCNQSSDLGPVRALFFFWVFGIGRSTSTNSLIWSNQNGREIAREYYIRLVTIHTLFCDEYAVCPHECWNLNDTHTGAWWNVRALGASSHLRACILGGRSLACPQQFTTVLYLERNCLGRTAQNKSLSVIWRRHEVTHLHCM